MGSCIQVKRHNKAKRFNSINDWETHIKKLSQRYQI